MDLLLPAMFLIDLFCLKSRQYTEIIRAYFADSNGLKGAHFFNLGHIQTVRHFSSCLRFFHRVDTHIGAYWAPAQVPKSLKHYEIIERGESELLDKYSTGNHHPGHQPTGQPS